VDERAYKYGTRSQAAKVPHCRSEQGFFGLGFLLFRLYGKPSAERCWGTLQVGTSGCNIMGMGCDSAYYDTALRRLPVLVPDR